MEGKYANQVNSLRLIIKISWFVSLLLYAWFQDSGVPKRILNPDKSFLMNKLVRLIGHISLKKIVWAKWQPELFEIILHIYFLNLMKILEKFYDI